MSRRGEWLQIYLEFRVEEIVIFLLLCVHKDFLLVIIGEKKLDHGMDAKAVGTFFDGVTNALEAARKFYKTVRNDEAKSKPTTNDDSAPLATKDKAEILFEIILKYLPEILAMLMDLYIKYKLSGVENKKKPKKRT